MLERYFADVAADEVKIELSPWERVKVKWFNRHQGFGFVSRAEGAGDIFITRNVLKRCRVLWPSPNERLDVRWTVDAEGRLRAVMVAYPVGFVE